MAVCVQGFWVCVYTSQMSVRVWWIDERRCCYFRLSGVAKLNGSSHSRSHLIKTSIYLQILHLSTSAFHSRKRDVCFSGILWGCSLY